MHVLSNLVLTLLPWFPAGLSAEWDDKGTKPDLESLARDLLTVQMVRPVVDKPPRTLWELSERSMYPTKDFECDSAFGGKRLRFKQTGATLSCWITVASFGNDIVQLSMLQRCSKEREPMLWTALKAAWGPKVRADDDGFRWNHVFTDKRSRYHEVVVATLGARPKAKMDPRAKPHLEVLASPIEIYDLGTRCYYAGIQPAGRVALEAMMELGDPDPLRHAIRGLNPEGRVYAAEGLLRMHKSGLELTDSDRKAIEVIRHLPIPLRVCRGCVVFEQTAAEILKDLGF